MPMEKVFNKIEFVTSTNISNYSSWNSNRKLFFDFIKTCAILFYGKIKNRFGINFHFFCIRKLFIALLYKKISIKKFFQNSISPIDSVRYFEYHFGYFFIKNKLKNVNSYLDISSPRLFISFLINKYSFKNSYLLNPDFKDLNETKKMFIQYGIKNKVHFINNIIEEFPYKDMRFQFISSISVLEHIGLDSLSKTLDKIFNLLDSYGYLLISVPVAKKTFEEYINFNEYGLIAEEQNGFFFGQRFFDQDLIDNYIFKKFGEPEFTKILGEKENNKFFENRQFKFNNQFYPYWRESEIVGNDYQLYNSIDELPGIGVVIFLFRKSR